MSLLFAQRRTIGRVVLAAYGIGFAGVLLIGQRPVLLSVAAFVVTVLWRLANPPIRRDRMTPLGRVGWAPFRAGPWLFLVVPAILATPFLVDVLAGHDGLPDLGNIGLLMPRTHYTFVDHGVRADVEPWRFLALGLLFHTLWTGVGGFVAWVVFFKRPYP